MNWSNKLLSCCLKLWQYILIIMLCLGQQDIFLVPSYNDLNLVAAAAALSGARRTAFFRGWATWTRAPDRLQPGGQKQ